MAGLEIRFYNITKSIDDMKRDVKAKYSSKKKVTDNIEELKNLVIE